MIKEIIDAFEQGKILVFPSEVAASGSVSEYVRITGRALFNDSALSWDTFKDRMTEFPEGRLQAGMVHRALFVDGFFRDNFSKLVYYSNPNYSEAFSRFKAVLVKNLPHVKDAMENIQKLPAGMAADLSIIYRAWIEYMDENNLYEKKYFKADFSKADSEKYILVFPECVTDPAVSDAVKSLKSIGCVQDFPSLPPVSVYENTLCEVRNTMRIIYDLLGKGVRARDIALTVTDFDNVYPYIEEEANKRNIFLDNKNGKKLIDYNAGSLFSHFKKLYEKNFDFPTLRTFLLNPCFPFNDMEKNRDIIKTLSERNTYGGLEEHCRKLDDCSTLKSMASFIKGAVEAKTCEELRFNINQFENYYFTDGSFSSTMNPVDLAVFQKCMDNLDTLEKTLADSKCTETSESLFELFYRILSLTDYSANIKQYGIKVYSYPVSCALSVKYHFVIGLDDEHTKIKRHILGLMTKTEETESGLEGEDISSEIIKSYQLSENVYFSCAKEAYSGTATVASVFEELNALEKSVILDDSYNSEEKVWANPDKSSFIPGEKQASFFSKNLLADYVNSRNANIMPPVPEPIRISASSISEFETCPYKWMCHYVAGLNEQSIEPEAVDNLEIGSMLHETYERFFNANNVCSKYSEPANRMKMVQILGDVAKEYSRKKNATDPLHFYRIISEYSKKIDKIGEKNEKAKFSLEHYTVKGMERGFEFAGDGYICKGRIDCILEDEKGGFAVVDFKKGKVNGNSLQIFIYSLAMEKDRAFRVSPLTGAFYSIGEGKFSQTWTEEEFRVLTANTEQKIEEIVQKMREGNFEKTPSDDNCGDCSYSRICRSRYVIK